MKKRQIIISAIGGILVLGMGIMVMKKLTASKKKTDVSDSKVTTLVYTSFVKNKNIPLSITTSGSVVAKDRMVLFSEVQGIFMPSSKSFKAGTRYSRGETLIRINNEEFNASVKAKRSSYKNMITSILADIQFDYPNSLQTWKNYLTSIDINKSLPNLPKIESEKENNFITSRNINSTFYSIKNMETRLRKYSIKAPYTGILVDAKVTPGSLINPGMKLGEYIKPNVYELELNVNANLESFLKKGKTVELHNIEKTKTWKGKVTRINQMINRSSQTIKIYVQVVSKELKEGEYLEADVFAKEEANAFEIPRSLLLDNNSVYIVQDSILKLLPVELVYSNLNSVVIKGLENGTEYISKPIVGAYEGMKVVIFEEKKQ